MTAVDFLKCSDLGFKSEGGFVNNKADPGGATNKGITLATARSVWGKSFSVDQLRAMTTEQARVVYKRNYWDKINGDSLPPGVDYVLYDYGINSGPGRPIEVIHHLLNITGKTIDGVCLAAIDEYESASLIDAVCDERLAYMHSLRGGELWQEFGRGWGSRVADVRATAKAMANAQTIVITDRTGANHASAKAVKTVPVKPVGVSAAITSAVAAGAVVTSTTHYHLGALGIGIGAAVTIGLVGGIVGIVIAANNAESHPINTAAAARPLKVKGA